MENRQLLNKIFSILGLVGITVFFRLIPHPPNFAMVGALALFSGSQFRKKTAWTIPLIAMFLSDVFLGFHSVIPFVYGSFLLITLFGAWLKKNNRFYHLAGVSFMSSILFFVMTNFGVWLNTNLYLKNINGLVNCYLMAIPFFRNTLLSDVFFSMVFFYGYRLFFLFTKKLSLSFK